MIKKVASFPELLVATRILALHDSPDPARIGMLVSQYLVVGGIWNMFAFAHRVESLRVLQTIFLCYNLANSLSHLHLSLLHGEYTMQWHLIHLRRAKVAE